MSERKIRNILLESCRQALVLEPEFLLPATVSAQSRGHQRWH